MKQCLALYAITNNLVQLETPLPIILKTSLPHPHTCATCPNVSSYTAVLTL